MSIVEQAADCIHLPRPAPARALSASITTGGASRWPRLGARDRLDEPLPQGMESMLGWLGARRGEIKRRVPDI